MNRKTRGLRGVNEHEEFLNSLAVLMSVRSVDGRLIPRWKRTLRVASFPLWALFKRITKTRS